MPYNFKFKQGNLERIMCFFDDAKKYIRGKAIIEFRDQSSWEKTAIKEIERIGIPFCSVNAPALPKDIVAINDIVYLRLQGSKSWYDRLYSEKELTEILHNVKVIKAKKKAIYLNNDHDMLKNGLYVIRQLYV